MLIVERCLFQIFYQGVLQTSQQCAETELPLCLCSLRASLITQLSPWARFLNLLFRVAFSQRSYHLRDSGEDCSFGAVSKLLSRHVSNGVFSCETRITVLQEAAGNLAVNSPSSSPFQLNRGSPVRIRRCPATVTQTFVGQIAVESGKSDRLPSGNLHDNRRGLRSEPAHCALRPVFAYPIGHDAYLQICSSNAFTSRTKRLRAARSFSARNPIHGCKHFEG
jgi:hypothetical protein